MNNQFYNCPVCDKKSAYFYLHCHNCLADMGQDDDAKAKMLGVLKNNIMIGEIKWANDGYGAYQVEITAIRRDGVRLRGGKNYEDWIIYEGNDPESNENFNKFFTNEELYDNKKAAENIKERQSE